MDQIRLSEHDCKMWSDILNGLKGIGDSPGPARTAQDKKDSFCKKKEEIPESVNWNILKDTIYLKAQEDLLRLEESHPDMSEIDIFVVTVGKCLEEYSKSYPKVVQGGETITVEQAVNNISEIVEQLIEDSRQRNVPVGLDEISRFYLLNLVGKRKVSFNELNRKLLNLSITMDDLRNAQLVSYWTGRTD